MAPARQRATAAPAAAPAEQLARLVQTFVERDEIVSAEVLVVHRGEPIIHRAFGWRDRELETPMQPDTLFAVRSMTKPFTGTAAQFLIGDGHLSLDTPVADILPSFDNQRSRSIIVRHLLTHRIGLPVGFIDQPTKPLSEYTGLRELADCSRAGLCLARHDEHSLSRGHDRLRRDVDGVSQK